MSLIDMRDALDMLIIINTILIELLSSNPEI